MTIKQFFKNLWQAISDAQSVYIIASAMIFAVVSGFSFMALVNMIFGGYGLFTFAMLPVVARLVYAGFKGK